jgi:hypothetical protein
MFVGLNYTYEYLKPMQPILMHIKSRKFVHDGFDMQWVISNLHGLVKCDPIVFFFVKLHICVVNKWMPFVIDVYVAHKL